MKLFAPILAATLMQDTEAACDGDASVFSVTCHPDLMVELKVNGDCLTENFSGVKLTELQILPTGADQKAPADQCLPCIIPSAQTKDSASTDDYCDPAKKFFAFDYESDSPATAVTDDASVTTSLFFKAGKCGTSPMTISDDGTKAIFSTSIGKPAVVDKDTGIVTKPTLLKTDITCSYPSTISGLPMDPGMSVVADAASATDKVKQDDAPSDVSKDLFEMTTKKTDKDGAEITSASSVTLGEQVWIGVTSTDAALGTNFYLSDCLATNGIEDTDDDAYKSLKLVKGGCMTALSTALTADISPAMDGQSLVFNQFAFADSTQSALSLAFKVTCDIVLGTAPTDAQCATRLAGTKAIPPSLVKPPGGGPAVSRPAVSAIPADTELNGIAGRKRRSGSEYQESTEYTVTAGNKISDAHGDIVVAHSGESKTDIQDSGATTTVTTAAALMAGTAIMLL